MEHTSIYIYINTFITYRYIYIYNTYMYINIYTDGPEDGLPLLKILRKILRNLTASGPPRWNAKNHIDGMFSCQFWHFSGLQMECLQIWVNGIPSYVRSIPSSGPLVHFSTSTFHIFWWLMNAYFPHVGQIECPGLVLYYMCLHAHWTALWG